MALRRSLTLLVLWGALAVGGCAAKPVHTGVASWYGPGFAGKPTASGDRFRPARRTAAHKTLPFGTVLRVRLDGRSVRVIVNDRGPYAKGRALDLSKGAARRLGMIDKGVAEVTWTEIGCKKRYDGPRGCAAPSSH